MTADIVRENRRGVLLMVASMALFICNDAIVKHVGQGMSVPQLIFLRGLGAVSLIGTAVLVSGAWRRWYAAFTPIVLLRGGIDALATFLYQLGLQHLPLANVTAINLSVPLILTVLAVFVLNELVGWRRWLAVGVGFVGVLLVVQPTPDGFNWFALLTLLATSMQAVRDLITRRIHVGIPSLLITLTNAVLVTFLAGLYELGAGWQAVALGDVGLLLAAASLLSGGYWLVIESMRHGELSVVAPFRYTALVWALLLGYAVWRDVPNMLASAGIVLLVGSGLYILHRERLRARAAAATTGFSEPAAR